MHLPYSNLLPSSTLAILEPSSRALIIAHADKDQLAHPHSDCVLSDRLFLHCQGGRM
jgi:hypothetical protein